MNEMPEKRAWRRLDAATWIAAFAVFGAFTCQFFLESIRLAAAGGVIAACLVGCLGMPVAIVGAAPAVKDAADGGVAQAFTRNSNAECYRPCGRGVFDKTTNRTYLVYLNRASRPWIQYYDHTLNLWAPPQEVSASTGDSSQPDHLYPSLWIDPKGRIHVV